MRLTKTPRLIVSLITVTLFLAFAALTLGTLTLSGCDGGSADQSGPVGIVASTPEPVTTRVAAVNVPAVEGGTISLTEGPLAGASIVFPPGSLPTDTTIVVSVTENLRFPGSGFDPLGSAISIAAAEVDNLVLNTPAILTLKFDLSTLPEGVTADQLVVVRLGTDGTTRLLERAESPGTPVGVPSAVRRGEGGASAKAVPAEIPKQTDEWYLRNLVGSLDHSHDSVARVTKITIDRVIPESGSALGGTRVFLRGNGIMTVALDRSENFGLKLDVFFGSVSSNQDRIQAVTLHSYPFKALSDLGDGVLLWTPPFSGGSGSVTITIVVSEFSLVSFETRILQEYTCPITFNYTPGAPILESLSPAVGAASGGQAVTLTGTGFAVGGNTSDSVASVTFGGRPASLVRVVSDTIVTCLTPPAVDIGAVDVSVAVTQGVRFLPTDYSIPAWDYRSDVSAAPVARGSSSLHDAYTFSGGTLVGAAWTSFSSPASPKPRPGAAKAAVGDVVYFWSGRDEANDWKSDGYACNSTTGTWAAMGLVGAPKVYGSPYIAAIGAKVYSWSFGTGNSEGGIYDSGSATWAPMSTAGASGGVVVTDGTDIFAFSFFINWNISKYTAATDTWSALPCVNPPSVPLRTPAAALVNGEFYVWGGSSDPVPGGRYNVKTQTWTALSTLGSPVSREQPVGADTGDGRFMVWGGWRSAASADPPGVGATVGTGGVYDPATETWTEIAVEGAPSPRVGCVAMYVDKVGVVFWGGATKYVTPSATSPFILGAIEAVLENSGALYHPSSNSWSPLPTAGAPAGRISALAATIPGRLIVGGGTRSDSTRNFGILMQVEAGGGGALSFQSLNLTGCTPAVGIASRRTAVTLAGSGFKPTTASATDSVSVTFGGAAATDVRVVNDNTITCVAPPGSGVVPVSVVVRRDSCLFALGTSSGAFTYVTPVLTSLSPISGPGVQLGSQTTLTGNAVTLTGSGFSAAGSVPTVKFGGTAAANVQVVNDTTITCTAPLGLTPASSNRLTVDVVVAFTKSGSTATTLALPAAFTFNAMGQFTVNPTEGTAAGGTSVTLTGSGFTAAQGESGTSVKVLFGTVGQATNVQVVSDTSLTCVTPSGAGFATVTVQIHQNGVTLATAGKPGAFRYVSAGGITDTAPGAGPDTGGTAVTLTGIDFSASGTTTVSFGGTPATGVTVVSSTSITCIAPAHAAGAVDVVVVTGGQTLTDPSGYVYCHVALTGISPPTGIMTGGTSVTVTGNGLSAGQGQVTTAVGVRFGTVPATGIQVLNDTTLVCVAPPGSVGTVAVSVTISQGTVTIGAATLASAYIYSPLPVGAWVTMSTTGAPAPRSKFGMVAVGGKAYVWGGLGPPVGSASALWDTGASYNPVQDSWTTMSTAGAPSPRYGHQMIAIGTKIYVIGGYDHVQGSVPNGGIYDTLTNSWSAMNSDGLVVGPAISDGTSIYVFRAGGTAPIAPGARYNVAGDSWTDLPAAYAPSPRYDPAVAFISGKLYVWGGVNTAGSVYLNDGASFNPATGTWSAMPTANAPSSRSLYNCTSGAVTQDNKLMVWGGVTAATVLTSGGLYDPATNSWTPIASVDAPVAAGNCSRESLGTAGMVVWGGYSLSPGLVCSREGSVFSPTTNSWAPMAVTNAPSARYDAGCVVINGKAIIWGGSSSAGELATGAVFTYSP